MPKKPLETSLFTNEQKKIGPETCGIYPRVPSDEVHMMGLLHFF